MVDFLTVTIEQLPEASEASSVDYLAVQPPGGPMQKLPVGRLPTGGGGGGAATVVRYVFEPVATSDSLAHRVTVSVGDIYLAARWNAADRNDRRALFVVHEVRPLPLGVTLGDVTGAVGDVFVEGQHARFRLMLASNQEAAALGPPTAAKMRLLRDAVLARGSRLSLSGDFPLAETLDLGRLRLDWADAMVREPAAGFDGPLLRLAGGSIGQTHHSVVQVTGINRVPNPDAGFYDFDGRPGGATAGVPSKATGVVWGPDGQGGATREFKVNRLFCGVLAEGNVEKQGNIHVSGCANTILFMERETVVNGGSQSPDSNVIHLSGAYNKHILVTANNTSGNYRIVHEGSFDDGSFITDPTHYLYDAELAALGQPVPTPAVWVRSGKFHRLSIDEMRGRNGRLSIFVNKGGSDGADTACVDGLMEHNYGIALWVNTIQRLSGTLVVDDQGTGRSNYAARDDIPCPAFWLGRIYDASGFRPVGTRIYNRECYRIGNLAPVLSDGTQGLYPTGIDFVLSGAMGEMIGAVPHNPNPRTGWYPRTRNLCYVERMEGGSVTFPTIHGNIELGDGAQGVSFSVPGSFIDNGYSVVDNGTAYQCHVTVRDRTKFSHIANKAWLENFDQALQVEALPERASLPAALAGGRWEASAQIVATSAELAQLSSDLNWRFKKTDLVVTNRTTGTMWRSTGSAATSPWVEMGGAGSIIPAAHPALAAFLARMSAAPAAGTHWHFVYDRIRTELDAIWPAGSLVRFAQLGAHNAQAGNLDWLRAANDLVPHGGLTFTAGRGYTGDGSTGYMSSAHVPGADGETASNVWVHAHVLALGTQTSGDTIGSDTKSIRLRAANAGSNRAEVGSSSIFSFTTRSAAPRSIAASISSANVLKQWDNGALRNTINFGASGASPLPGLIDLLRGYDPTGALWRHSDETLMLFAYGKDATDERMAAMARLSDDAMYWARAV